jgi:AAA family ATP:ADP antiporter
VEAPAASTGAQRLLGVAVDVRRAERRAILLGFAYFFALLASYYLLRPIREEMGIRGGVQTLQWSFTATFVALTLAVPAYSALFARVPRARAVPAVYRFFLLNLVAFWILFRLGGWPVAVARSFFVWLSVFNLLVVSVFWSFMADLFSAEQGKRLFGFVAAGGSLGAIAGSAAAGILVGPLGIPGVLALSAALLEIAARCAGALAAWARGRGDGPAGAARADDRPVGGTALSGVAVVFRSPYLLALAAQMLLFTLGSTFLYFQQARIVADAIPDSARRTALFAAVDLAVNVVALAIQSLATGRIATAFGLGPALSAVPLVTAAGFAAVATVPSILVLAPLQAIRRIGHYALERPARDVLFTVVPREEKYKSKGFIDTVVYRGGDAMAAWVYTGLAGLGLATRELALAAVPAAGLSLAVGLWLARRERRMEAP